MILRLLVLAALLGTALDVQGAIFAPLLTGSVDAEDLPTVFSEVELISQLEDRQTFHCRHTEQKIESICVFENDGLRHFSLFYQADSPELKEFGGWDRFVSETTNRLGQPKRLGRSRFRWAISDQRSLILDTESHSLTHIDLPPPTRTQMVQYAAAERPHHLKGWRSKEWTKWITLTQGTYSMEARHEGRGNFIVYMFSDHDKELLFNEVGKSYDYELVHVNQPEKRVRFLIKKTGGLWEIDIKKSSEDREPRKVEKVAVWTHSASLQDQMLALGRSRALALARESMASQDDETGFVFTLTHPSVPGTTWIGRTAGDVLQYVENLNADSRINYELHSVSKVFQSRMIERATDLLFSSKKVNDSYRADPDDVRQQILKMAKENNSYLTIHAK